MEIFKKSGSNFEDAEPTISKAFVIPFNAKTSDCFSLISNIAVVIGAGPGGLISARSLQKSGKFNAILIIEKRSHYTRKTAFNLRPQCFPMFKQLDLLTEFEKAAQFVNTVRFHQYAVASTQIIEENFDRFLDEIDYSKPTSSLFDGYGWPHHALQINCFEHVIAKRIVQDKDIFLINAEYELKQNNNVFALTIRFKGRQCNSTSLVPKLIVVAEGAKSVTRDKLVGIKKHPSRLEEKWFTADVSLENIASKKMHSHFSVEEQQAKGLFTISAFLPHQQRGLINGNYLENVSSHGVENLIKKRFFQRLLDEKKWLSISLPNRHSDLKINYSNLFRVRFQRAAAYFVGQNLVFAGDAAGTGSPLGGYGITLLASVYAEALIKLAKGLSLPESRTKVLNQYAERVDEIINHWQSI